MGKQERIATRDSYGRALKELGGVAEDVVVLDADLAGATRSAVFQRAYPDRFFNCGIAEANMIGVAAGLSTMGLVPFVSSFAMFLAGRAYEQVRNSIGYPHLNVKLGATHGGISVGEEGATHQCCEDIALMRSIPGMTVMCPADDIEARQMVKAAYAVKGPVYMRFGREFTPVFHDENYQFQIGKGEVLQEGTAVAIIATGIMVSEAIEAGRLLAADGISARIINMPTIKPIDTDLILESAGMCGRIVTVEEHNIIGGLGEAVCSVVAEGKPVPVKRIGINDVYGHSGKAADLLSQFGLRAKNIAEQTKIMIAKWNVKAEEAL